MQHIVLKQGLVVVAQGSVATVVQCLPGLLVEVLFQRSKERKTVNIDEIEVLPETTDENLKLVSEMVFARAEEASIEEYQLAEQRYDILKRYMAGEIDQEKARQEMNVSNGIFYKLKKLYEESAGPISLLRLKRGRKIGQRTLDFNVEEIIQQAIREKYSGKAASLAAVWRRVEELCLAGDLSVPARNSVASRLKDLPARDLHKKKHGAESASQNYGARPGKKITSLPLEHVQMDHTLVDVILVDNEHRCPLGRPWLTVLIDIHTRVILGYYLSLHHPSTISVAGAMTHAALPKRKFLQDMGLPPECYPFFGVPKVIHMDNAKEFKSTKFIKACVRNNIKPEWRPYGAKHYGGHVERLIGTIMTEYVHFLPGTTLSNVVQRKGYHSEKNSALTFKEFSRWFAGQVAIYHGRKHKAIQCSPKAAWESCFTNRAEGAIHPPLLENPWAFRLDFMPEETRKIHPAGVTLNNRWYWNPALVPFIGLSNVTVKYDPFSMATIWIRLDNEYTPLYFSDMTKSDYSYEEYRASQIGRRGRGGVPVGGLEDPTLVDVIKQNDDLVKESIQKTKASRKKEAARSEYLDSNYYEQLRQSESAGAISNEKDSGKPDYTKKATPYARRTK
ncbi:Mu transposase C-terminal domain-containing protein [Metapseudomonas resinovorans]|uniref:Mu transposase C-terminal domain-containing protein n=1 Tax=Metapseudomonas resinovorans TaxID=53412 RepID=UPI00138AE0C8|nr:Mu transposase C-terminal domain-containing protein [Pseudomonas resinovorans]